MTHHDEPDNDSPREHSTNEPCDRYPYAGYNAANPLDTLAELPVDHQKKRKWLWS